MPKALHQIMRFVDQSCDIEQTIGATVNMNKLFASSCDYDKQLSVQHGNFQDGYFSESMHSSGVQRLQCFIEITVLHTIILHFAFPSATREFCIPIIHYFQAKRFSNHTVIIRNVRQWYTSTRCNFVRNVAPIVCTCIRRSVSTQGRPFSLNYFPYARNWELVVL